MFCSRCGNQIPDGVRFCPQCGGAQPPTAGTATETIQLCRGCGRPNWRDARECYACQGPLGGTSAPAPSAPVPRPSSAPTFEDVGGRLPSEVRRQLLPGEPAYAYLQHSDGCGSSTHLLVTDSRVIVKGPVLGQTYGCGSPVNRTTEIPLQHVSSVSEQPVPGGCGGHGLGVSSGSTTQVVRGNSRKEMEGALRILQALLRANTRR